MSYITKHMKRHIWYNFKVKKIPAAARQINLANLTPRCRLSKPPEPVEAVHVFGFLAALPLAEGVSDDVEEFHANDLHEPEVRFPGDMLVWALIT
jgi:hypothetical protein